MRTQLLYYQLSQINLDLSIDLVHPFLIQNLMLDAVYALLFTANLFDIGGFWLFLAILFLISLLLIAIWKARKALREKQQLEAEIAQQTLQLEKERAIIQTQAAQLQQIDATKNRFFTNVTHEIRTPLSLILGPVEQMLSNGLPKSYRPKVQLIKKNAEYLLGTVNELLDMSKAESGSMKINYFIGDIIAFSEELIQRFQPLAEQKQQQLIFETELAEWNTNFDKEKYSKIVHNLLSNALKFTPEKGLIQVEASKIMIDETTYIMLSVKDSGMGIAAEHLPYIFDRFYQINTASTQQKERTGGIGLALVKELVDIQGGAIEVKSVLGEGTIFKVQLPVLLPQENDKDSKEDLPDIIKTPVLKNLKKKDNSTNNNPFNILLIEDNPDMRTFIRQSIESSKYIIQEATNGAEGIELALCQTPDLIISDIMMPHKNGHEVTKAIRSNINTSHIPIILLTAKAAQDSQFKALEHGADVYLTKPFSVKELNLRVWKLLESRTLLKHRFEEKSSPIAPKKKPDFVFEEEAEFMQSVEAIIAKNIDKTALNGAFISERIGMNRMSLHRKLKKLTNQSATEMIREFRLQRALQDLKEGKGDVAEIAYQVGFNSPGYFTKLFKKRFDLMPSQIVEDRKKQLMLERTD